MYEQENQKEVKETPVKFDDLKEVNKKSKICCMKGDKCVGFRVEKSIDGTKVIKWINAAFAK